MKIIRREFLFLSGTTVVVPAMSKFALAQAQAGPKLTQILRNDLEGQGQVVQETVVSVVEFGPGTAAPWHTHPGAQELLYVIDGSLVVEVEGKGISLLKTEKRALFLRTWSIWPATIAPARAAKRWSFTAEPQRTNR